MGRVHGYAADINCVTIRAPVGRFLNADKLIQYYVANSCLLAAVTQHLDALEAHQNRALMPYPPLQRPNPAHIQWCGCLHKYQAEYHDGLAPDKIATMRRMACV